MMSELLVTRLYHYSTYTWALTLFLWLVLWLFNPYALENPVSGPGIVMLVAALLGITYSWLKKPIALLAVALVSFFPIGIYLLGTPGLFLTIGLLNAIAILLAVGLIAVRFSERKKSARDNR